MATTAPTTDELDGVEDRTGTYCVIGAGSSGLAVLKNFREHGLDVECFEAEPAMGGNWNFSAESSRVYETTHLISSKPFTGYPDFPMPDRFPDYPHHSEMYEYLQAYMHHFGLDAFINFETAVEAIEPVEGGDTWQVTVRGPDGEARTADYAGVVIANGHNWHPKQPEYPGEFTGEVIHSAEYDSAKQLEGKRVLIVGAGNTGCDLVVDAAQHAEHAFHSTRRAYWYAPKYIVGKPADQVHDIMMALNTPHRLVTWAFETTLKLTVGDLPRQGLPKPDHRMLETHPIVNSLLPYYVGHGEITPKPDIDHFDGDEVVFNDGSREQVDLVVYATGYLAAFPFLDVKHLNWDGEKPQLYEHIFSPAHDNLFVCGLIQPDSGQFTLVHWQSVLIAKFLRAQTEAPERAEALRQSRVDALGESYSGGVEYMASSRHFYEINHYHYLRSITQLIHTLEGAR